METFLFIKILLEQDTKMREFILISSQTFPLIEKVPFQKRSIPLYRVYNKLLLTSHSGQRNELFDQYRLFAGYLKYKINQKVVNLNFQNPGGCVYSTVKKWCQWLEHLSGFALLFRISSEIFSTVNPLKRRANLHFVRKINLSRFNLCVCLICIQLP